MEVIYSKSAAQVTKLIKELKYKLATRIRAIESLKVFYEENNHLPDYCELESQLGEINNEQINIHFGSFMSFVDVTFQDNRVFDYCISKCKHFIKDYFKSMHTFPSPKAISHGSEEDSLVLYSENEVNKLLEYIDFSEFETLRDDEKLSDVSLLGLGIDDDHNEKKNSEKAKKFSILEKYHTRVYEVEDLQSIPIEDVEEVLKIFHSKFSFIEELKLFRENYNAN